MRARPAVAVTALFALAACDNASAPITSPAGPANRQIVSETSSPLWSSIAIGETGPGSSYAMYVPRAWNGTTVFYAHGIRDVLEPLSLRDQNNLYAMRDALGARGYAVAYSSFDDNGFAEPDAVRRTHQLRGLFTSQYGAPQRSILAGHSLGALAVLDIAQQHSTQYAGVAALCPVAGGTPLEVEYMATVRMLFDMFYPGILPGRFDAIQPGFIIDAATQQKIVAAVMANPTGLAAIASVKQAHLEAIPGPAMQAQLVQSLITALSFHARGADNLLSFTNGKFPYSNVGVVYTASSFPLVPQPMLDGLLAMINANAPRTAGEQSAINWVEHHFTPSGAIPLPTLTLHNAADPLVPAYHESVFGARVASAGASSSLVQRILPSYGHCAFSVDEQVQAIVDVDQWSATGVRPAN